jgi:hypothetical protein
MTKPSTSQLAIQLATFIARPAKNFQEEISRTELLWEIDALGEPERSFFLRSLMCALERRLKLSPEDEELTRLIAARLIAEDRAVRRRFIRYAWVLAAFAVLAALALTLSLALN